jgi:hypothetical protein
MSRIAASTSLRFVSDFGASLVVRRDIQTGWYVINLEQSVNAFLHAENF